MVGAVEEQAPVPTPAPLYRPKAALIAGSELVDVEQLGLYEAAVPVTDPHHRMLAEVTLRAVHSASITKDELKHKKVCCTSTPVHRSL
eukprot:27379-Eustigmatos_ZCMA.PRE.1